MNRSIVSAISALTLTAGSALAQCGSQGSACQQPERAQLVSASHASAPTNIVATAQAAGKFSTLLAAARAAGLAEALMGSGPFTVFAPTDDAFDKLPDGTVDNLLRPENRDALASILKFHVVAGQWSARDVMRLSGVRSINGQRLDFWSDGSAVKVNGAKVVAADIECTNGVIHVIDTVVTPESGSIVDVAQNAGTFGTLIAAAQAAGLAEALSGEGPFTVFAPTDEAFSKLPRGTVESLLRPENRAKLASILKYHVVPGRVYAADAAGAGKAQTLNGQSVVIDISDGRLRVDGANIVATNIDASNGVVHVIDRVILPE
ncbi:MAG: fasciclin domain-containing protein [Phycisphaeraceae bacterium]|nr:fasciclin domain-containing protein [Phycisphaeraceae bacterium]